MARFIVAILTVPLVFIASLLGALMITENPSPAIAALPAAMMFALVLLSRDTTLAVGRAGLALVVVGVFTLGMRGGARSEIGGIGDAALALGFALIVLGIAAFAIVKRMQSR